MEGKQKTYLIYKIIAPTGQSYIGYTSMSLEERWRNHKYNALKNYRKGHPFYDAIRKYPLDSFKLMVLEKTNNRLKALKLEEKYIKENKGELSMNLSAGGINDASEGGRIFWERINADPQKRADYLKKLSDSQKKRSPEVHARLCESGKKWRKENPKEAYRLSYRAIRIANKKNGRPSPSAPKIDDRPLKERLMHKYKLNDLKSVYVTEVWKKRTASERKNIGDKISKAQKKHMESLSADERKKVTIKARESIDRKKQGEAASKGLKKWWEELRKNPQEYEDYINRRKQTNLEKRFKHENL